MNSITTFAVEQPLLAGAAVLGISFLVWRATHGAQKTDVSIPSVPKPKKKGFTKEELAQCKGEDDGKGGKKPLYCSVKGVVYEVSPQFYGPGAGYHCFAGAEASRNLGRGIVSDSEVNAEWRHLKKDDMETLDGWAERFAGKYAVVGWYVPDSGYAERGLAFDDAASKE